MAAVVYLVFGFLVSKHTEVAMLPRHELRHHLLIKSPQYISIHRWVFYIDDILILGSTYTICSQNTMEALHLLIRASFIIHWKKSSLNLSTDFPFLGFQWNTVQASITIPQVKIDALHSQASILSNLTCPTHTVLDTV
jgi:hypothetical protein